MTGRSDELQISLMYGRSSFGVRIGVLIRSAERLLQFVQEAATRASARGFPSGGRPSGKVYRTHWIEHDAPSPFRRLEVPEYSVCASEDDRVGRGDQLIQRSRASRLPPFDAVPASIELFEEEARGRERIDLVGRVLRSRLVGDPYDGDVSCRGCSRL